LARRASKLAWGRVVAGAVIVYSSYMANTSLGGEAPPLAPSARVASAVATSRPELDRAVAAVRAKAREFARLSPRAKADLLRGVLPKIVDSGRDWVVAACRAKGISPSAPVAGEEWIAGPMVTVRNVRLLVESLEEIVRNGRPKLGRSARPRPDGRMEVDVFPASPFDSLTATGFTCKVLLQEGVGQSDAVVKQASFYQKRDPEGEVALILGAGNVSSIPPMDALYKMFVDGAVCVVKMNPVNEWVGPFLEKTFEPFISRDFMRVVYGGGDAGAYLCQHADIDSIHITGSDKTHDLIVWGPPGPERERRKRDGDPLLKKRITSELGNVSPIAIVPAVYSDDELSFQARSVVSMVVNNASFNCNAGKMLVLPKGWPQRDTFMSLVAKSFAKVPPRKAYYPGAHDRYESLVHGHPRVDKFGQASEDALPWALIRDVDSSNGGEVLFHTEPFCGILSQTEVGSNDPAEFLAEATRFCNDTLWGTLNATIVIHPRVESDASIARALEKAIVDLRYGSVAINHWPALVYGYVTPPWGGHPSATLKDIQSGLGWVHNTFMLEGIDKSVVRGPLRVGIKPAWFYDNTKTHVIGERLLHFEAAPSWLKAPALAIAGMTG
jgi:acyl-CoA reductase-like NAD-dependent aldehyde dehydrogenase